MTTTDRNTDPAEIAKFDAIASRWWDPESEFKPLHEINPLRLAFIAGQVDLADKTVVDVGCGGGLLTEAMAARHARVTGIDMAESSLAVARLHLAESGNQADYRCITAEDYAAQAPGSADIVTCMELLEHVPDPASLVAACARIVRPGGNVFFSTINRNPKSYALAIFGAEYMLRMLPKGTHDFERFIRPSELAAWMRAAGLEVGRMTGLRYNPLSRRYSLSGNVDVNYMVHAVKE